MHKKIYKIKAFMNFGGKNVYIQGCNHFLHNNIIKYTGRVEFLPEDQKAALLSLPRNRNGSWDRETVKDIKVSDESIRLMSDHLIDNINSIVKEKDIYINLGDFSFAQTDEELISLRKRIRCKNFFIIAGNHDNLDLLLKNKDIFSGIWPQCTDITIHGVKFVLSHYPMLSWHASHKGSVMCHSHVHGALEKWKKEHVPNYNLIDVGCDVAHQDGIKYKPFSFDEIMANYKEKPDCI